MQQPKQAPKIYIIVLTWNQSELTADSARSLMNLNYPQYRVVVVDNGSHDDTVEKLHGEFGERIDLIANSENLGFSAGNNVGIRHALDNGADYVMLLNNDTVVDPEFLQPLVSVLQSNNQIGVVTPKIYFMHKPQRIWAAGGEICWWLGRAQSRGRTELDHGQYDRAEPVDHATGCCMLIPRIALEKVGLLDERYFAYWEDADWCMRARRSGFQIWYEPSSKIWHIAGVSSKKNKPSDWKGRKSPFRYYLATRNNIWFIRRHCKRTIYPIALLSFVVRRLLFYSLTFIILRRWSKLKHVWQGAYDGWLRFDTTEWT